MNKIIPLSWLVLLVACTSRVPAEIIDSQGAGMRLVPAGEFTMGSDTDNDSSNSAHVIHLDAFYMDVSRLRTPSMKHASRRVCVRVRTSNGPIFVPVILGTRNMPASR